MMSPAARALLPRALGMLRRQGRPSVWVKDERYPRPDNTKTRTHARRVAPLMLPLSDHGDGMGVGVSRRLRTHKLPARGRRLLLSPKKGFRR
jgi:hypothetical protein